MACLAVAEAWSTLSRTSRIGKFSDPWRANHLREKFLWKDSLRP